MAYFSSGTEGMIYEEHYCVRCVHHENCAILNAHFIHNYDECNKPDSILHMLIPRSKDGLGNEQCLMFYEGETERTAPSIPLKGTVARLKNRTVMKVMDL